MSQSTKYQELPAESWAVFLSHTSELRNLPCDGHSYVSQAERAMSAAGHRIVNMADFPAQDMPPAEVCIERVRACDVYVGILGIRYGSLVKGMPSRSYTELEFDTATQAGMTRLIFLLDRTSEGLDLPAEALIDHDHGRRQEAFLERVQSELTVRRCGSPGDLRAEVLKALWNLRPSQRRSRATPRPVPYLLPYLPDRDQHKERMSEALERLRGADRASPLVVILHGEDDQRVGIFRDCFFSHSLSEKEYQSMDLRYFEVRWPEEYRGNLFDEHFRQRICKKLYGDSFCEVTQPDGLAVLWSNFDSDTWGEEGAGTLEQVCRFWRENEAFANKRLIHWVAITYKKPLDFQPKIPLLRWFERKYWQHRISRHRLRKRNGQIRSTLNTIASVSSGGLSPVVLPEMKSVCRDDAVSWVRSQPVEKFLREQSPQGLEDAKKARYDLENAVNRHYRLWEAERGMAEIPLEHLGAILRKELEAATAGLQ